MERNISTKQNEGAREPAACTLHTPSPGDWAPSFFSVAQAAEVLNLSPWTLRGWRWRAANGLPLPPNVRDFVSTWKSFGRAVRVPADALRRYAEVN